MLTTPGRARREDGQEQAFLGARHRHRGAVVAQDLQRSEDRDAHGATVGPPRSQGCSCSGRSRAGAVSVRIAGSPPGVSVHRRSPEARNATGPTSPRGPLTPLLRRRRSPAGLVLIPLGGPDHVRPSVCYPRTRRPHLRDRRGPHRRLAAPLSPSRSRSTRTDASSPSRTPASWPGSMSSGDHTVRLVSDAFTTLPVAARRVQGGRGDPQARRSPFDGRAGLAIGSTALG